MMGFMLFGVVTIDMTVAISDVINLLLLVLTLFGLLFTVVQLFQTKKINRASLAKELYWTLYDDSDLRSIFYKIEWSEYSVFDIDSTDLEEEKKLDKLLSFFEIVCSMYYRGVFTKKDIELFDYELCRVCSHPCVQEYWKFLEKWQCEQKIGDSFVNLKKYYQSKNHNK